MMNLKRKLASAAVATSMLVGGGIAVALPAQAADASKYHVYWTGSKAACEANLAAARPGFGSYVRLVEGCVKNGNGYAYTTLWR